MSGALKDVVRADLRLVVLRLLEESGAPINSSILRKGVAAIGNPATADQFRAELKWLDDQGLIQLEDLGEGLSLAHLMERGEEVARGRATYEGVARPSRRR